MFFGNSTANTNPESGIRYGVTSRVPNWVFDESLDWDCPAEKEAYADAARARLTEMAGSGELDAGDFPESAKLSEFADSDELRDAIAELTDSEATDLIESVDSWFSQSFFDGIEFSDFPRYGESEGVKMRLSSLGGAPLLWILDSPYRATVRLCSPCVPNAGDLDSPDPDGCECYAPGPDFYDGDESE